MKLVVVADDYGLCESVNQGVVDACKNGIVTELSLMLGSPATDHALALAKDNNIQNIGIHMLLKNWRDTGALVRRADYIQMLDELSEVQVAELVRKELEEFEQLVGRKPIHITSQFGIIAHERAISAVVDYALMHNIPMRQPVMTLYGDEPEQNSQSLSLMRQRGARTTDHFFAHILGEDYETTKQAFKDDLATVQPNETAELCLHPGYVSEELKQSTSLVYERERDTKLAADPEFRRWMETRNIQVVGYQEI